MKKDHDRLNGQYGERRGRQRQSVRVREEREREERERERERESERVRGRETERETERGMNPYSYMGILHVYSMYSPFCIYIMIDVNSISIHHHHPQC